MPHMTTCTRCGKCYEEGSEEAANLPTRECSTCWHRRQEADREEREFADEELQRATGRC